MQGYGDAIGNAAATAFLFVIIVAFALGVGALFVVEALWHHLHIAVSWT